MILGSGPWSPLVFGYIFPYVACRSGSTGDFNEGIDVMLPANWRRTMGEGMPFYGGALALILGVLAIGSEFGWGTWKTLLTQRPGRAQRSSAPKCRPRIAGDAAVHAGRLRPGAVASRTVAIVEDATMTWPAVRTMVEAVLSGWLILAVWAAAGVALATCTRGTSLAIGLGILWALALRRVAQRLRQQHQLAGMAGRFAAPAKWLLAGAGGYRGGRDIGARLAPARSPART